MAFHHQDKATELWLRRKTVKAGRDLKAAALNVEYGVSWAGEEVESRTSQILEDTRDLAGRMIRGASGGVEKVGAGSKTIRREIGRLGMRIVPVRRR